MVAEHFSEQQRGRATALFDVGSYVGAALAAPLVVLTMTTYGWQSAFVLCAVIGVLWAAVWHLKAPRDAQLLTRSTTPMISVVRLARDRRVVAASCGFFCYNYVKSVVLAWFPLYLVSERHVDIRRLAIVGMLPPIAAIVSELSAGALMDRAIRVGVSKTRARKTCLGVAFSCGATILAVGMVDDERYAIALFMIAFAGIIAASPAIWALPADIAPSTATVGVIGGLQNTVANFGTIVGPLATGAFVQYTGSYTAAFAATAIVSALGGLAYTAFMPTIEPIQTQ